MGSSQCTPCKQDSRFQTVCVGNHGSESADGELTASAPNQEDDDEHQAQVVAASVMAKPVLEEPVDSEEFEKRNVELLKELSADIKENQRSVNKIEYALRRLQERENLKSSTGGKFTRTAAASRPE
eukprot:gnl/TRDRNA2_/TRDRNA2_138267_c0_seq1.p1 gnl/TRDRNA2_/TRDRNA2_138267_c0~~gnl/TRDRNA2_/TRDRNA2_138267_c0_seq1.p1  ORF type:complete len:126 (-),score=30.31 gnl/TRDRNA2_/TRDRNA2_138267_c0_seq1:321-698(-)